MEGMANLQFISAPANELTPYKITSPLKASAIYHSHAGKGDYQAGWEPETAI